LNKNQATTSNKPQNSGSEAHAADAATQDGNAVKVGKDTTASSASPSAQASTPNKRKNSGSEAHVAEAVPQDGQCDESWRGNDADVCAVR
jgi:hypothetical protein